MKPNYTDITVILDRSASMAPLASDTIGGFNKFLEEQKAASGEATFSLYQFGYRVYPPITALPIAQVKPLTAETYVANDGGTALLDAVGSVIQRTGQRLSNIPEVDRPSKVVIVIITDGQENCSHLFRKDQVRNDIAHQQSVYNWEFVFLGANQDAFAEGQALGIKAGNSMTYNATDLGTQAMYSSVAKNLVSFRTATKATMCFEPEDLAAQGLIHKP